MVTRSMGKDGRVGAHVGVGREEEGNVIWLENGMRVYGIAKVDLFEDLESADPQLAGKIREAGDDAKGARLLLLYRLHRDVEAKVDCV
jgi:hypothetical protein